MIFVAFGLVIATGGLKSIEADPVTSFAKLAAVLLFATYVTVAPRRAIAKAWRNTPLLHEAVEGELDEPGVKWHTQSVDVDLAWEKVVKQKIADDFILLYSAANSAMILPRSYFATESDWQEAQKLVATGGWRAGRSSVEGGT